jgi:hypothetical protein
LGLWVEVYADRQDDCLPQGRITLQVVVEDRKGKRMDALCEALNSVRITGAIFYHAVCTSPWAFEIPPLREYACLLAPGTERLVSYHLITEGDAIARFGDAQEVPLTGGDVLIVPHGDPHVVSNGRAPKITNTGRSLTGTSPAS